MIRLFDITQHCGVRPVLRGINLEIQAGDLVNLQLPAQAGSMRIATGFETIEIAAKLGEPTSMLRVPHSLVVSLALLIGLQTFVCERAARGDDDTSDGSNTTAMAFPGADWEQATPESQGVDSEKLNAAAEYLRQNSGDDGVKELVIIRNGRMIWAGDDIDKQHGVWSLTKSFTSTVLGLLIEDGKATLDTLAQEHVPEMVEAYPDVTLRHFTTMTSGYYAVGDEPRGSYTHGPSSTPFQPAKTPLFTTPGSRYAYWDSAMNQFAHVLARIAGEPIEDLFKRRIADPIGMNRDKWDWPDFGEVKGNVVNGIVVNGGAGNAGKSMHISARELARFGHLFLNRGNWSGKQLISTEWVDAATQAQVPASTPLADPKLSDARGSGHYGYNWWTNGKDADGNRKWPRAPADTYSASGFNNNDMFVIPSWNMVIVRLGLDQGDQRITDEAYSTFLQKVGQAIGE